jgi:hypothetical protein
MKSHARRRSRMAHPTVRPSNILASTASGRMIDLASGAGQYDPGGRQRPLPAFGRALPPRPHQAGKHQYGRVFDDTVEHDRSNEGIERAAHDPAEAHPDVEFGEPCRRRSSRYKCLVANQGRQEEGG